MDKRVGKRIQSAREQAGISQEMMADQLGLSVTAVSNIERGQNYPTLENFIKIANVLGASADLLLADVVNAATTAQASILSSRLSTLPAEQQRQIFAVIEAMLSS